MDIPALIKNNSSAFLELCQQYRVKTLYAFGSSVVGGFDEKTSDIDLLVELDVEDAIEKGLFLMELWDKLEILFQRKIDLLTESSIRNPILKKSIDSSKILIYDGKKPEVFV